MKVNKSSLKTTWQILLAAAVVAGCGALSEAKRDAAEAPSLMAPIGTGCVQGVVINGLTGDRIQMR
ncbi:MAG: hypothetical protein NTV34_16330, partial [Proteobacteria bacterium]|nr:hypothetical protein [Pseudomonadota bacterium]